MRERGTVELGPEARALIARLADALERIAEAADAGTAARHVIEERLRRETSIAAGADELARRRAKAAALAQKPQGSKDAKNTAGDP